MPHEWAPCGDHILYGIPRRRASQAPAGGRVARALRRVAAMAYTVPYSTLPLEGCFVKVITLNEDAGAAQRVARRL